MKEQAISDYNKRLIQLFAIQLFSYSFENVIILSFSAETYSKKQFLNFIIQFFLTKIISNWNISYFNNCGQKFWLILHFPWIQVSANKAAGKARKKLLKLCNETKV